MNKEVLYRKDVLKEVAKRLDMTDKEVEYNYKALVHVMKEMMADPEVATIIIPKIGKLSFKAAVVEHMQARYKEKDITPSARVSKLFEKLENLKRDPNMRRKSYFRRSKINQYFYTKGLSKKEMEESQNKHYNEHKKRYNNN